MATKKKKKGRKVAKKKAIKKVRTRPLPPGADDIGYRERKLQESLAEARLQADLEQARTLVCPEHGDEPRPDFCGLCAVYERSRPAYFPVGELTVADVLDIEGAIARLPLPTMADRYYEAPPEPYVAPPLADPPVLPDLAGLALEFHTPHGRRGQLCDVAFALLPEAGVVLWRTTDRLAGEVSYMLAAAGDLSDVQTGEVQSRAWYRATDEQHAAIAACDLPGAAP